MHHKELFKRLGFPKHTEKLYTVLQNSETPLLVTDLAKETKVSRVVVYRCLTAMLRDKLIEKISLGKRTYYEATSPQKLTELIQLHNTSAEEVASALIKKQTKDVPRHVRFLRGAEGIRAAFDDVIEHAKKGETFFRYTSEKNLEKVNSYLSHDYRKRRDAKKLERKVISNALSGSQKQSRLERFIKFIPVEADQFEHNIIELIYGSRVSIIDLEREEVTIIENQKLADFQKVIFKLLYRQLPRM